MRHRVLCRQLRGRRSWHRGSDLADCEEIDSWRLRWLHDFAREEDGAPGHRLVERVRLEPVVGPDRLDVDLVQRGDAAERGRSINRVRQTPRWRDHEGLAGRKVVRASQIVGYQDSLWGYAETLGDGDEGIVFRRRISRGYLRRRGLGQGSAEEISSICRRCVRAAGAGWRRGSLPREGSPETYREAR